MMATPLYINIDRTLVEEALLRMLSDLEPDSHTPSGKRDMRLKAEVDGLIGYLQSATPLLNQSAYPTPSPRR